MQKHIINGYEHNQLLSTWIILAKFGCLDVAHDALILAKFYPLFILRILKIAGNNEIENAIASYNAISSNFSVKPIWAVAENYRFEPAFVEVLVFNISGLVPCIPSYSPFLLQSKKLVAEIGNMMSVQVIVEGSMNSANPYFLSSWRRNFTVCITF